MESFLETTSTPCTHVSLHVYVCMYMSFVSKCDET